jgi:hypothetical protein
MTTSEQARTDAIPYRCLDCDFEISGATRWWHQHQGHHTVGPLARGEADSYQARADAMADAETLRRALRASVPPYTWRFSFLAIDWRRHGLDSVHAQRVAHAAFRAVPELRGEP